MRVKAIENLEQCTLVSLNSLWADDLVRIMYIVICDFFKKKTKVDLCSHVLFTIKD